MYKDTWMYPYVRYIGRIPMLDYTMSRHVIGIRITES